MTARVRAAARAFRQKRMLESRDFATITELAAREGIAPSDMTRGLRRNLLGRDIVQAILDGKQGNQLTLAGLVGLFPPEWVEQHSTSTDPTNR